MQDMIKEYIGYAVGGLLGILWFDMRSIRKKFITKESHDELCSLKLGPIQAKLDEIHKDVKELSKNR